MSFVALWFNSGLDGISINKGKQPAALRYSLFDILRFFFIVGGVRTKPRKKLFSPQRHRDHRHVWFFTGKETVSGEKELSNSGSTAVIFVLTGNFTISYEKTTPSGGCRFRFLLYDSLSLSQPLLTLGGFWGARQQGKAAGLIRPFKSLQRTELLK